MHVDIDIMLARHREDAVDLASRIGVGVGRGTDDASAFSQRFGEERLGTRIVGQAFLWKGADLDFDRKGIVLRQAENGVEAAKADARIDFDMDPHQHRAMADAVLEHPYAARVAILLGEALLRLRRLGNRLGERSLDDAAAIDDAGLVEMDAGLAPTRR